MHFTEKNALEKRSDFVKILNSNKLLRFPGAYNPLCANFTPQRKEDNLAEIMKLK